MAHTTNCPAEKRCGGCALLSLPYEEQLERKQREISRLLKPFCKAEPVIGMEAPFHYRNKVHAVFGQRRDGTVISGTYEEGTHRIVPVESCLIEDETADQIIGTIRRLIPSFKYSIFREDNGTGLIRHVLVRIGKATGQTMVVLVTASRILPSKRNFVRALLKEHPQITTIVQNINDRKTSMILGEREEVLYGPGYIEDRLCGLSFRISSRSFYQVNPVQTEKLYSTAIRLAGLTKNSRVIDAYSGIGTIGLIAAAQAGEVISIELNAEAVRDARTNAKRNKVTNIRFFRADATQFMKEAADIALRVDTVFMDPPRTGSTPEFIRAAAKLKPGCVIYISCNPVTLARDLGVFKACGYTARRAVPVDMFPQCSDIETVVLLTRSK